MTSAVFVSRINCGVDGAYAPAIIVFRNGRTTTTKPKTIAPHYASLKNARYATILTCYIKQNM
jgi:hypothetical protein